jgi:hypothetical protein
MQKEWMTENYSALIGVIPIWYWLAIFFKLIYKYLHRFRMDTMVTFFAVADYCRLPHLQAHHHQNG